MSFSFFKALYYPASESKEREINNMQPKTFRKILDCLFRGRVTLSCIEDAKKEGVKDDDVEMKEEKAEDSKKGEAKAVNVKNDESTEGKTDERRKIAS